MKYLFNHRYVNQYIFLCFNGKYAFKHGVLIET